MLYNLRVPPRDNNSFVLSLVFSYQAILPVLESMFLHFFPALSLHSQADGEVLIGLSGCPTGIQPFLQECGEERNRGEEIVEIQVVFQPFKPLGET